MAAESRKTNWRQGDILTDQVAAELIKDKWKANSTYVIVISHDCDLASYKEHEHEIIICYLKEKLGGGYTDAQSPRRLDFKHIIDGQELCLSIEAPDKRVVSRKDLFRHQPRKNARLKENALRTLQRWLCVRYSRAAFPDEFNDHIDKISDKMKKLLKRNGEIIRGLLFKIDNEQTIRPKHEAYQLTIVILYSTTSKQEIEQINDMAEKIEKLFNEAFRTGDNWKNIELTDCYPMSDRKMRVYKRHQFKVFRLEYISLRSDPPQVMLDDD